MARGSASAAVRTDRLLVEHGGEEMVVAPSEELTFGRCADLVVDTNPYLHRTVGRFRHDGRCWWLDNVGRAIALTVWSVEDLSSATVGPGSSTPLLHVGATVGFTAGPAAYEIEATRQDAERRADLTPPGSGGGPPATLEWGRIELNPDQVEMLVVMCGPRLQRPADQWAAIPSNRSCASELGWTLAKFNRKLDHLCEALERAGVRGVHGDLGLSAVDRRRVLVDHVVRSGLIDHAAGRTTSST